VNIGKVVLYKYRLWEPYLYKGFGKRHKALYIKELYYIKQVIFLYWRILMKVFGVLTFNFSPSAGKPSM